MVLPRFGIASAEREREAEREGKKVCLTFHHSTRASFEIQKVLVSCRHRWNRFQALKAPLSPRAANTQYTDGPCLGVDPAHADLHGVKFRI